MNVTDIIKPIVIFIITLLSIIALSSFSYRFFKKNQSLKIGILLGLLHFLIVVTLDVVIKISLKNYPESGFLWMLMGFFDLPIVLLFKLLKLEVFYSSPYIAFGIFGSLQYFVIGLIIGVILKKSLARDKR